MIQKTYPRFTRLFAAQAILLVLLILSGCDMNSLLQSSSQGEESSTTVQTSENTGESEEVVNEFTDSLPEESTTVEAVTQEGADQTPSPSANAAREVTEQVLVEKEEAGPSVVASEEKMYRTGLQDYSKGAFDQAIKNKETVLVDVYAGWCPTCQANAPHLSGAISQLNNAGKKVVVFRVDYDKDREFLKTYGVPVQSTYLIFKEAKEVTRVHGLMNQEAFVGLIS